MTDGFSIRRLNLLDQSIVQPTNDNLNLALNIIEYLSGNDALREIRSRGQFQRPFTRVIALQQEAQLKYQQEENQLQTSLDKVQRELNNLLQGVRKGDKEILLPKEVQDQIASFREQERQTRRELREVMKILRQDIEELRNNLLLANLLIVPSFVGLFGFLIYPKYRLFIILVGLILALALFFLITKTNFGIRIRAGQNDREMISALGVNISNLYTALFVLGASLAGLAGALVGTIQSLSLIHISEPTRPY